MLNMSYSELEKEVYRCFEIFIPSKKLFYGVRTFPVNPANLKTSLCRSKLQPALNKGMPVSLRTKNNINLNHLGMTNPWVTLYCIKIYY